MFYKGDEQLDERVRDRLSKSLRRKLESSCRRDRNINALSLTTPEGEKKTFIKGINGQDFHDCLEICQTFLRNGECVSLHQASDYNETENYLSEDGMQGFALNDDDLMLSTLVRYSFTASKSLMVLSSQLKGMFFTSLSLSALLEQLPSYHKTLPTKLQSPTLTEWTISRQYIGNRLSSCATENSLWIFLEKIWEISDDFR